MSITPDDIRAAIMWFDAPRDLLEINVYENTNGNKEIQISPVSYVGDALDIITDVSNMRRGAIRILHFAFGSDSRAPDKSASDTLVPLLVITCL